MKVWQCSVCKYIHKGEEPPGKCPVCGVSASKFVEIDEASIQEKPSKIKKPVSGSKLDTTEQKTDPSPLQKETIFKKIEALLLEHHAHPVSVHAPNGILPVVVLLWLMAWIFSYDLFAEAAFINLIFVVISLPFVIFTGTLEWKRKYNSAMTSIFKIKIIAAALTTVSCVISSIWYLIDPEILSSPQAWVFILINILMLATAGVAGLIGGKLVFKD